MVAFEQNGAVYWVTNTLLDDLSNETMISIAKGLQPLIAVKWRRAPLGVLGRRLGGPRHGRLLRRSRS